MPLNDTSCSNEIPYGYCHCGCGQKTTLAKATNTRDGTVKGQPCRYLPHHATKKRLVFESPNPSGLCMCGCGQPTAIARVTDAKNGYMAGQPKLFVNGHANRKRYKSIDEQFWANVARSPDGGCWDWQGTTDRKGYGRISINGKRLAAHRYSYEMHHGSIPNDMYVLHRCDRPICVAPHHLFLGDQFDNMQDCNRKGRGNQAFGERSGASKLKEAQVREIRSLRKNGLSHRKIAKRFNVSANTIQAILHYETWKHVE